MSSEYTVGLQPFAIASFNTNGDNTVIAGVTGQKIYVYSVLISGGTATDVTFKDGASTIVGGPHIQVKNVDLEFQQLGYPLFTCSSGNNLVINLGAGNAFGGTIWAAQR